MDIFKVIEEKSIKKLRFLVNMKPIQTYFGLISLTSSSDPDILMLCEIVEDRYKVKDNYKITLQSVEQFPKIRGREHYYISDLNLMIKSGSIKVLEIL
jgi:hypothetical protein